MADAFATFKARVLAPLPLPPELVEMPTLEEGMRMLRERPDAAAVLTDQGRLSRDGTLTFPRWS
jgi:hypothetical protein